ncbi:FadR/GntR family transcriptional regulator [Halotalea alkalilenta]|uniref:FadR/GntR family transcriptional regulator n=1 Tax=Halotalea alkalilenta TaxID=376489 RepID=UPI000480E274|nr:FCD domain-containing protein [Halotalea alkalilenta]
MAVSRRDEIAGRRRGSLSSHVADAIEEMIQSEEFDVGDKLPTESELGRMFDVSRTVIREAVSHLKSLGVVESRRGVGAFIRRRHAGGAFLSRGLSPSTADEILQLLEFRLPIEIEAAGLAAQRRTDADLAALAASLEKFASPLDDNLARREDFEFHRLIGAAARNPVFVAFYDSLGEALVPRSHVSELVIQARIKRYLEQVLGEHRQIFARIEAADAEGARAAMREHLRRSFELYRSRVEPENA